MENVLDFENELSKDYDNTFIKDNENLFYLQNNSDFVDEILAILSSDNMAIKKQFFLDNQGDVQEVLFNLNGLLNHLNQHVDELIKNDPKTQRLLKVIGITIKRIEKGIEEFQKALHDEVSKSTIDSSATDISLTKESIMNAMQHNENTKRMNNALMNPDKNQGTDNFTEEILNNFNSISKQRPTAVQKRKKKNTDSNYLIMSGDGYSYTLVQNCHTKQELNKAIRKCDLENPRVFSLVEIPTVRKTVKTTVTEVQ